MFLHVTAKLMILFKSKEQLNHKYENRTLLIVLLKKEGQPIDHLIAHG